MPFDDSRSISILELVFGPTQWAKRAALAFGCCVRHVNGMSSGRWPMTRRHWAILENVVRFRKDAIEQERRLAHERVDKLYDEGQKRLEEARRIISRRKQ